MVKNMAILESTRLIKEPCCGIDQPWEIPYFNPHPSSNEINFTKISEAFLGFQKSVITCYRDTPEVAETILRKTQEEIKSRLAPKDYEKFFQAITQQISATKEKEILVEKEPPVESSTNDKLPQKEHDKQSHVGTPEEDESSFLSQKTQEIEKFAPVKQKSPSKKKLQPEGSFQIS
jgi:hypothetical protein